MESHDADIHTRNPHTTITKPDVPHSQRSQESGDTVECHRFSCNYNLANENVLSHVIGACLHDQSMMNPPPSTILRPNPTPHFHSKAGVHAEKTPLPTNPLNSNLFLRPRHGAF